MALLSVPMRTQWHPGGRNGPWQNRTTDLFPGLPSRAGQKWTLLDSWSFEHSDQLGQRVQEMGTENPSRHVSREPADQDAAEEKRVKGQLSGQALPRCLYFIRDLYAGQKIPGKLSLEVHCRGMYNPANRP